MLRGPQKGQFRRKESKAFFFEKKKQKTFVRLSRAQCRVWSP